MKRHIAEFLGELAEELGWEPEFEGQRVVPERQASSRSVAMHDMPSSNELRLQRLDEEVRQWPAHLLPKPAPEPAPPVREAVTGESAKNDAAPAEPAHEPDPEREADEQKIEPEAPTHSPPVEPPAIQPMLATPTVAEVDNESPLELFPSEPRSASAKNAGASTPAS